MSNLKDRITNFVNLMKPVVKQGWLDTKAGIMGFKNISKPKVYRLRGYTTTTRIDKKVRAEQKQRTLRNILVAAIFVLIMAVLLIVFNPFKDLREIFRMIGI